MEKRIIIIDGNSLINRAYYAMQRPMSTKDGMFTQGIYGFLNMFSKILKDYEPTHIVVTFDKKAPTFRHVEFAEYKAGRKKMPPELAMQIPILKEVLIAMNVKIVELEGFEADDLIGTIAVKSEKAGFEPYIITGDRDALQLATDITKVIITKKGISEFELYDKAAMIEKYRITPAQFIDLKGLMGDSSDNIPGIPGIGEKTGLKLLYEYGTLENILEKVDSMPASKLKEKISENAMIGMMSKRLATINTEVPIEIDFTEYEYEEPNYPALIEIYKRLEFNSFLKKMKDVELAQNNLNGSSKINSGDTNNTKPFHKCGILQKNEDEFESLLMSIKPQTIISINIFSDNNHKNTPEVYGIGITTTDSVIFYSGENNMKALALLGNTIYEKDLKVCGHYLTDDYYALLTAMESENMLPETCERGFYFNTYFDTAIGKYVLDPAKSKYDFNIIAFELLNENIETVEELLNSTGQISLLEDSSSDFLKYMMKWAEIHEKLVDIISENLEKEDLKDVYASAELPLIEILADMERYGIKPDKSELTGAGAELSEKIANLTDEIYEYAGEEFNINSPAQLGTVLFEKLQLPSGKKTKRGYSTSADVLEKIYKSHPIIPCILEYRTLTKLKGTYIDGIIPIINVKDGRIHAKFQQTVTATGRLSCTEPNLQNIPIRQEIGRKLRKAFVPENGFIFTGADYSQIELRVLAHMSGEEHLIEAFNNGDDIHRITASRVFGIPQEEVTPLQRSNAKAVNFGVIYGMSGFGLADELNIAIKQAEQYIKDYFSTNTKVKEFMDNLINSCKKQGFVTTILGRKRYIQEINASNYMVRQLGERLAMNSPIQGSAADIIKLAMINVYRRLKSSSMESRLILQIHDELIIETKENEKEEVAKLLVEAMESAMTLKIKLEVDLNTGYNWYDLK